MGFSSTREEYAGPVGAVICWFLANIVHVVALAAQSHQGIGRRAADTADAVTVTALCFAMEILAVRGLIVCARRGFSPGHLALALAGLGYWMALLPARYAAAASLGGIPFMVLGGAFLLGVAGCFVEPGRSSAQATLGMVVALPFIAIFSFGGMASADGLTGNPSAREERACRANRKNIDGALEMYLLEKKTSVTPSLSQLVEGGYLQSLPDDPGEGRGTANHYILAPRPVHCTVHHN